MHRVEARSHRPWISLSACLLAALVAVVAIVTPAHAFTVAGATDTVFVASGGTFTIDFVVSDPDLPFNAFDLSVHFDPARLTNSPMSPLSLQRGALMVNACTLNQPFHIFTPGPDSVVGTLVILCDGVSVTAPARSTGCGSTPRRRTRTRTSRWVRAPASTTVARASAGSRNATSS
jgi:hypothetical protein